MAIVVVAGRVAARAPLDLLVEVVKGDELYFRRSGNVSRVLLERKQPHGFISLDVTAHVLHLTPRTLHRRLVAEGTSFRALLDELRQRLCAAHLQSAGVSPDHLNLEELGWTLGYTDFANFRRAFKRWHGVAPGVWRRDNVTNVNASAGS